MRELGPRPEGVIKVEKEDADWLTREGVKMYNPDTKEFDDEIRDKVKYWLEGKGMNSALLKDKEATIVLEVGGKEVEISVWEQDFGTVVYPRSRE